MWIGEKYRATQSWLDANPGTSIHLNEELTIIASEFGQIQLRSERGYIAGIPDRVLPLLPEMRIKDDTQEKISAESDE